MPLVPGIVASGFTVGPIFEEQYVGVLGAGWDGTRWSNQSGTTLDGAGSGKAQPASAGYGVAQAWRATDPAADIDLYVSIQLTSIAEHYPSVCYRQDSSSAGNFYQVSLNPPAGSFGLERKTANTGTWKGGASPSGMTATDLIHLHIQAAGSLHQGKIWRNAETEPAGWGYTVTDATYASQTKFRLVNVAGSAQNPACYFRNVRFYAP